MTSVPLLIIFCLSSLLSPCYPHCSRSTLPDRKLFYHNGEQEDIKLLTRNKVESRLVAAVFRIFSTEVLGYDIIVMNQTSPSAQPESVYDTTLQGEDLTFRQLSSR